MGQDVGLLVRGRYNRRSVIGSGVQAMRVIAPFLFLVLIPGSAIAASVDGDSANGKTKAYTCTGCHGISGYNNIYPTYKVPRIGGQNAPYLVAAMNAYKSGERLHSTMRLQAESLSDQDIKDISAWLSSLELTAVKTASASNASSLNAAGREKLQLCEACHGADGVGLEPDYPRLAGQHASYLRRALQDYRDGKRQNVIMAGFAGTLSDRDIEDLASWYAGMDGLRDLSEN